MNRLAERLTSAAVGAAGAGLAITAIDEAIFSTRARGAESHPAPSDLPIYILGGAAIGLVTNEISPRLTSACVATSLAVAAGVKLQRIAMP